jgi:hypothetical protein
MFEYTTPRGVPGARVLWAVSALLCTSALLAVPARAQTLEGAGHELSGRSIIQRLNQRGSGRAVAHRLLLRIRSPQGHERDRGLLGFRAFVPQASYLAFYATSPPDMRNQSYVVHDFVDSKKADNQWVFTPTRATPRRIPDTNRKESFLGSEFTLEDVKKVFRVEVDEYEWELREKREIDGRPFYLVEQRPKTTKLAKALGISRMRSLVDGRYWVRVEHETWDLDGKPFKLFVTHLANDAAEAPPRIQRVVAKNLRTGAESEFVFEATRIDPIIPDWVFTIRGMSREDVGALEKIIGP